MRVGKANQLIRGVAVALALVVTAHAELTVSEMWEQSLRAESAGNYDKALKIHSQIIPKAGKSYASHLRAGWLFCQTGSYSQALDHYEKASDLSSGAISPLLGIMNCQVALGNEEKATKAAKAVLVIDALNYTANLQLASLCYQDNDFSLASSYYRKLNRLYPEDLAVASGLAWSYLEQGWAKQALPLFQNILMISPNYAYAERGLAACNQINKR